MTSELKLTVSTIVGIIVGLLTATGHLNATDTNQTQNDIISGIGSVITIVSTLYLFEHQLEKVKADLWTTTPDTTPTQPAAPSTPTA